MADSVLRAVDGEKNVVECTFVESPIYKAKGIDFFSSKVTLGPKGVETIHELGLVNEHEQGLLDACLVDLAKNIAKGQEFVKKNP